MFLEGFEEILRKKGEDWDAEDFLRVRNALMRPYERRLLMKRIEQATRGFNITKNEKVEILHEWWIGPLKGVMTRFDPERRLDLSTVQERFRVYAMNNLYWTARDIANKIIGDRPPNPPSQSLTSVSAFPRRRSEEAIALEECMNALTPMRRRVLYLKVVHELKHKKIAEELEISEHMSKHHLFQARKSVNECLRVKGHLK